VIAALTGPAGAEDGDGCCRLSPTPEGFRKLDSWSGVVSERKRGPNSYQCRLVPDEQAALQAEIDRLAKENAALREQLATAGPPPAALLRPTNDALHLLSELPFGLPISRLAWELKVRGLAVIFTDAFYKCAWSYRLFNYAASLIGTVRAHDDAALSRANTARAAHMNVVAGRHFTRGSQAFISHSHTYVGSSARGC
jgi:Protein of unknown function, DUF599